MKKFVATYYLNPHTIVRADHIFPLVWVTIKIKLSLYLSCLSIDYKDFKTNLRKAIRLSGYKISSH